MPLISRYFLRKFYFTLLFMLLAVITIFLTVDLMENLNHFLDSQIPTSRLLLYYELFIPQIVYLVMPIAILLTLVILLGGMARHRELDAVKSAGISLWRVLRLFFLQGLILSLLMLYLGESLVADANRQRLDIYREYILKAKRQFKTNLGQVYIQNGNAGVLHMGHYDIPDARGREINYEQIVERQGADKGFPAERRIAFRVDATQLNFDPSGGDDSTAWAFHNGTMRIFRGDTIISHQFVRLDTILLQITPRDLASTQLDPMEMNYLQLREFITRLRDSGAKTGKWEVDLQSKLATPFVCAIMVFFALPFAASRRKGVVAIGFGVSLLISFLYYGSILLLRNMGYNNALSPLTAAWLPHLVFLLLGMAATARVRK